MASTRDERRAQNQIAFRHANERLLDATDDLVPEGQPVPFVCECADEECLGRVEVKPALWEVVAERPNHFLIIAGHPRIEGEDVVDTLGPYEVVEKPD
jgi:hypothetical protein